MRWQTARWMRPQKVGDVLPHFLAHGAPLHIIPAGKGAPSKRKPILHLHSMGIGCILWMKLICSRCVEAILCVASQKGAGPFSASAVHLEPYRYWRACSRIRTNAILRACKAMPKDWENSACMQNREYRAFGLSSPALLQNEPAQAYGHGNGPAIKTQTAERAYLHAAYGRLFVGLHQIAKELRVYADSKRDFAHNGRGAL